MESLTAILITNLPPREFSPSRLKHVPAAVNGRADSFFPLPAFSLCNPAWPMTFLNQKRKGYLLHTANLHECPAGMKHIHNMMQLFVNVVGNVLNGHLSTVLLLSIWGTYRMLAV